MGSKTESKACGLGVAGGGVGAHAAGLEAALAWSVYRESGGDEAAEGAQGQAIMGPGARSSHFSWINNREAFYLFFHSFILSFIQQTYSYCVQMLCQALPWVPGAQ